MKVLSRSIQTSMGIMKWDFISMFFIKLAFALLPLLGIYLNRELFQGISNYDFTERTIVIIILYCFYLLVTRLEVVIYDRYYLQFQSLLKFEKEIKLLLHKKCSQIGLIHFDVQEHHLLTLQAQQASINIYRITEIIINLITSGVGIITISVYFMKISPLYIVFILLASVPTLLEETLGTVKREKRIKEFLQIERREDAIRSLMTSPRYIHEIKSFNIHDFLMGKWKQVGEEKEMEERVLNKELSKIEYLFNFIKLIGNAGGFIMAVGFYLNRGNFGQFTATIAAFGIISGFTSRISELFAYLNMFTIRVKPYFTLMDQDKQKGNQIHTKLTDGISLKDVSFKYINSDTWVLNNINLHIERGQTIALVGRNGSGKTTLSKLILGLYQPQVGALFYDGYSIEDISEENFFTNKSAVFQDFCKYPLTLIENISLGKEINKDSLAEIQAYLNDFNINYDKDLLLGKEFGGSDLSGGEWQKLAIIRSIVKGGEIVLFDEPTSAIDPLQEAKIYERLENLFQNKTGIIVTHKLSSIQYADRIIVLDKGKIIEEGRHEELVNKDGLYAQMYRAQLSNYI